MATYAIQPSYFRIVLVQPTGFLLLEFHGLANEGRMNALKTFAGFAGRFQTARKHPYGLDLQIKNEHCTITQW